MVPSPALVFNPGALTRDALVASFVVRQAELDEILDQVRAATAADVPQHVLVIGWDGMGKTTLLHRLAYAVEDDPELNRSWIPIRFHEQQVELGGLGDLWLGALEELSEATGDLRPLGRAEQVLDQYPAEAVEEAARSALHDEAGRRGCRLLLLVDNLDLVLSRIDGDVEASRLREVLQHDRWLMLVGCSERAIEATYHYEQPFYDMFRIVPLEPLGDAEAMEVLEGLAQRTGAGRVARLLRRKPARLGVLNGLLGGNPRTLTLFFGILAQRPGGHWYDHLERLLDLYTGVFRERIGRLSAQAQRVVHALAQRWDPATAEQVARDLRLDRGVASGQLHRLVDRGLVEKVDIRGRALGFQLRDRFFNLWALMRGPPAGRRRLRWLVEYVPFVYEPDPVPGELAWRLGKSDPGRGAADPGTLESALEAIRDLESAAPDSERLDAIRCLLDRSPEPDRLEPELRAAIHRHPDRGDLALLRAVVLRRLGRAEDAAKAAVKALAFGAPARPAETERLLSLDSMGRHEDGLALVEELAAAGRGEAVELVVSRAYFLERLDRAEEALSVLEEARSDSGDAELLVRQHVGLLLRMGRIEEALRALRSFELDTGPVRLLRAAALSQAGRYDDALRAFETALEAPDSRIDELAAALAEFARVADEESVLAARALARVPLELASERVLVQLSLGRIETRLGRFEAASMHLKRALEQARPEDLHRHGREFIGAFVNLARAGQAEEALSVLQQARAAERWRPLAHALAVLAGGDRDRLWRVAPEVRRMAEDLIAAAEHTETDDGQAWTGSERLLQVATPMRQPIGSSEESRDHE